MIELSYANIRSGRTCSHSGGTPYNGLYVEAPSERGTFSGSRVGISQVVIEVVELTNKIQKYIN